MFYSDDLEEVENGIRQLNTFSSKAWILSAILLYTLIYNRSLYQQSGLNWQEYSKQSRKRLELDQKDITEQLSAARFFIKYHEAMERAGWKPNSANRKLARAELALSLSGDIDAVIKHLVEDTWLEFNLWYSSFKIAKIEKPTEYKRNDIVIEKNKWTIQGINAITISNEIPAQDRERLNGYITQIFKALQQGYEPAIVAVYDKKEASILPRLRDKYRQGK